MPDAPSALATALADRYRIERELGRGGMAVVYLAEDLKHHRRVAIKVLKPELSAIVGSERFLREIEIVARLSHPHVLPLHDSGEMNGGGGDEGGSLYFVTPFVSGESLRDRLNREPALTVEEVLRLGREIAQALDYAHRQGVVHLDVKPENILLQDGHAVVADFGIARAMTGAAEEAGRDGTTVLGTPSYMSPEQARGEHDIDGRSDVYSLGCMLFEMIAGRRPFSHATHEELLQHAMAPRLPDRTALLRDGTREIAAVIERAMAPERDRRFATAGELAH
ncbi:MAG TPA: serine/threonine-protein kinase, partial [Gemmatimonadales bacterium]|nr:serine/threonine-protein kinase [Gemmatimonadales bacterium]